MNSDPSRPGNTQNERTSSLEAEMQNVQKKMQEFSKLTQINAQRTAAKMDVLKVPTEEEWRNDSGGGQSSAAYEQWKGLRLFR